jgi:hypothetical protein
MFGVDGFAIVNLAHDGNAFVNLMAFKNMVVNPITALHIGGHDHASSRPNTFLAAIERGAHPNELNLHRRNSLADDLTYHAG